MDYNDVYQFFIEHLDTHHKLLCKSITVWMKREELYNFSLDNLKNKTDNYYRIPSIMRVLLLTGMNFLSLDNLKIYEKDDCVRVGLFVPKEVHENLTQKSLKTGISISKIASYYVNVTFDIIKRR